MGFDNTGGAVLFNRLHLIVIKSRRETFDAALLFSFTLKINDDGLEVHENVMIRYVCLNL